MWVPHWAGSRVSRDWVEATGFSGQVLARATFLFLLSSGWNYHSEQALAEGTVTN